jgi:hypothetical protein
MNMKHKLFVLATLLVLGFVCGCNGGGGGPVELQNVCEEMKDALCDYMKKCDLEWYLQFAAHMTCEELIECDEMGLDEMEKSVAAGRLSYDAALAGKCLQSIRNAKCGVFDDIFENLEDECGGVFAGLVALDGDCYMEQECSEGLYCDESVSYCPGQCQPYKNLGDTCSGGDCDPDVADCDWQQGICVELAGAGEVCDNIECQDGLVCDYDTDPAVCLDPAGAGGSCSSARGCETGLQCLDGVCTGPANAGQECDIGDEFEGIMFACAPNYYCDADIAMQERTGVCKPKKGAGSECILFYECKSGLLCIGLQINEQTEEIIPGSCGQPLKTGAACNADFDFPECDWDLYCDEQTAVCTAFPGIGDPCIYGEDPECFGDDLYCDSLDYGVPGLCAQKKPDESSCTSYEECQSGNCINGTCEPDQDCIAPAP